MGRYHLVRGVPAAASGSLPAITMDACDVVLASIAAPGAAPVLRHDVNPAYMSAAGIYTMQGKDRGQGRLITAQRDKTVKIDSEPLFKNNPCLSFLAYASGGASDLTMSDYWRPNTSLTVMAVVTIDAVLKATPRTARIWSVISPSPVATKVSLYLASSGALTFGYSGATCSIPAGSVPAANVPFIVWAQYSVADANFNIGINDSTIVATVAAPAVPTLSSSDLIGIGSATAVSQSDNAWHGKMARLSTFTSRLSAPYLTQAIDALRAKYIT